MIVLDTSTLLFWTLDPEKVSDSAHTAIAESEIILISSISIWELAIKVKRQKLDIPISIDEYVSRLERLDKLEIRSVDTGTWLENVNLSWDHRDPADRTIVALAIQNDCPLITSDGILSQYYPKTIW